MSHSRAATLFTAAFLLFGTGGTLALAGMDGAGGSPASASFNQYRPLETPPVSVVPAATTVAPAPTPPAPAPAAPAPKPGPLQVAAALSTHGVATVSCPDTCHITLRARHGSRLVHVTVTLNSDGTTIVSLTKHELRQLGRGSVVVSVYVDGKAIASRKVRLA
jgi:hypothetical protein